jgi:lipoate-protein ligase A
VGAVSRCGLLTRSALPAANSGDSASGSLSDSLFDVEQFRVLPTRHAMVRLADHPTVVLGSTQRVEIVNAQRAAEGHAEVVRRRGGGGAVLLQPHDHLWIDAWVPRDDPLWDADVAAAATWVGSWWRAGLESLGIRWLEVHEGRSVPGDHGALVCFSGKGPGEVFQQERKVMGVSQWRGREGALFHTCAYTHWDPRALAHLLEIDPVLCDALVNDLQQSAVGVEDLALATGGGPAIAPAAAAARHGAIVKLGDALLTSFLTWGEGRRIRSS